MKVFIVDDSLMFCNRLTNLLETVKGVQVIGEAHDVQSAIDSIEQMHPEVVILDIQIPGGSGMDVLQEIKKGMNSPLTIMLTNYASSQYRKKYLEKGADYFFDKSTEFDKIPIVLSNYFFN